LPDLPRQFEWVFAVQSHASRRWTIQRPENVQQRTLARAAGTENRDAVSRVKCEGNVPQDDKRLSPRGVLLRDILDSQLLHVSSVSILRQIGQHRQRAQSVKGVFDIILFIPGGAEEPAVVAFEAERKVASRLGVDLVSGIQIGKGN